LIPIIQNIATEFKTNLREIYGDSLADVILYGSYARGDFHDESDVDFAVVLKQSEINPVKEIYKTAPVSTVLGLKYNLILSTLPISDNKLRTSMQGLYQNIRREGISI
jgi:predicted nucleotidyltransferase